MGYDWKAIEAGICAHKLGNRLWHLPPGLLFPAVTESLYSRKIYPFYPNCWAGSPLHFPLAWQKFCCTFYGQRNFLSRLYHLRFFKPKGSKLFHIAKRILSFLILICTLYNMFVFFWGLNYARLPLKDSMHLDVTEYSKEELAELTYDLVASTNAARKTSPRTRTEPLASPILRNTIKSRIRRL